MVSYYRSCSAIHALILVLSVNLFTLFLVEAHIKGGFSVDYIHRASKLSPSYNPSLTRFDRLQHEIRRSVSRVDAFMASAISSTQVSTPVASAGGAYIMKIGFGTPPVETYAIADTGSDLIWIQCKPCENCYKQNAPLFDPLKSITYKDLSCTSQQCAYLDSGRGGCSKSNDCLYLYKYGDSSSTLGLLATETFTLGSTTGIPVHLPRKTFGCGHNNGGSFSELESGIVGLGGGPLSLISQLNSTIGGKFSYCLVPLNKENVTSKLIFGTKAVVSGPGVTSTPLITKEPVTFYYVTLEGISVGEKKFAYKSSSSNIAAAAAAAEEGNIILDSGTTLTYLPSDFYLELESEMKKLIKADPVQDPSGIFSLCYDSATDVNVTLTVHFSGGDVKLKPLNLFVDISEELTCFTFVPSSSSGGVSIYGNIAQMNFLVGHDLVNRKVYFKPAECGGN